MQVTRRHPEYESVTNEVTYLARSYNGAEDYAEGDYLEKYPREEPDVFRARKDSALYIPYPQAVVGAYVSEVFRFEPTRETESPRLEAFTGDATGDGVTLSQMMRYSLIAALATNHRHLLVDLDEDGEPYVHSVHPANLVDYSTDKSGGYTWALIAEEHVEDSDPEKDRVSAERYRLWTAEEWILYDRQAQFIERGNNRAGRVPLVSMDPGDVGLPIKTIADVSKAIYNIRSLGREILNKVTFPQMYAQDAVDPDTEEEGRAIEIGLSRLLAMPPGSTVPPGFIAPPDGPIEQHRKERKELVAEIYHLAGLERTDPDEQRVQSGVAKSYDFRETNARLANAALLCQRTEDALFSLIEDYGIAPAPNVTYRTDFDVRTLGEQLASYLDIEDARLPDEVKRFAAKDLTGKLTEQRTAEERREAQDAVDGFSGFSGPSVGVPTVDVSGVF